MARSETARRSRNLWSPGLVAGLVLGAVIVLIAVFAPVFLQEPAERLTQNAYGDITEKNWLGTDAFGRDMFARSLVATRLTLLMTIAATAISIVLGIVIGLAIWLAPRRAREICLRFLEVAVSYPTMIFAVVIAAILGPGIYSAVLAIGIAGIPGFARITANLAARVAHSDYITTARLLGVSKPRIAVRHMLPNMSEPLLVVAATNLSLTLVEISALSFIGLGVQSPDYDFGRLLNDSLSSIYTHPVQAVGPSVMIVLTGLAFMLIGDGLAAASNPRTQPGNKAGWRGRAYHGIGAASHETTDNPAPWREDERHPLVSVENLHVSTPAGKDLVKGISLRVYPGEVLGLVGESGSGKSLTAMSIAGLPSTHLTVNAEELRVGELNMLGRPSRRELARRIGIIYQDPGTTFNPSLRMGGQLTEVLRTHYGKSKRDANEEIVRALDKVNITDPQLRLKQHPHELSGGMRQRAMIASAIATRPELLIADEPTTALDVTVQAEVLRQFKALHREQNTAMVFISHDLGVVSQLCDTVLVMKDGEIVERLSAEQLTDGDVHHPYTKKLIAAVPRLELPGGNHPAPRHAALSDPAPWDNGATGSSAVTDGGQS